MWTWLRRFLKPRHHEHLWRWIAFPYIRQCSRCGLLEGDNSEVSDTFGDYVRYLEKYSETRMFPKSAVKGYHAFREGCCPLAENDPIHDPEILKQINEGTF